MKILLKTIKILYLIIGFTIILIIGISTWLIRKWLQWVFSIKESELANAPLTDEVINKIKINKIINLNFIFKGSDKIINWFDRKIYKK